MGKDETPAQRKAKRIRLEQNKNVVGGTLKRGAKGNYLRRYNAKTGRWDIVSATQKTTQKFLRQKKAPKSAGSAKDFVASLKKTGTPQTSKRGNRSATSATVSGIIKKQSEPTAFGKWLASIPKKQEERPKGYKNPYKGRGY